MLPEAEAMYSALERGIPFTLPQDSPGPDSYKNLTLPPNARV